MLCISRRTDDTYSQNFGNNHHKFYIELRCNLPCPPGKDVCSKCEEKSDSCKVQHSRKFNHGKVNEPIPDNSHIYGGKWYYQKVKVYKEPSDEIIKFAEKYQREARDGLNVEQPVVEDITPISEPTKKPRKPRVAKDESSVKKSRKPRVAPDSSLTETNQIIVDSTKTATGSRKKSETTPYTNLISNKATLIHKEVTLPTHIETKLDEIDADGYKIEYVRLSLFEHNGSSYFKDDKKNKLYKKVKDKIGPYIGRYNSENDSIVTDIPDSDDEE